MKLNKRPWETKVTILVGVSPQWNSPGAQASSDTAVIKKGSKTN